MNRKEFLIQMGVGAGAAALLTCMSGCSKSGGSIPSAPNVDFTLDLSASNNSPLLTRGGYIYQDGVIVAYTSKGTYIALSQTCTHQGSTVVYDLQSDTFYCPSHGSDFSDSGSVNNGPAQVGLKLYTMTKSGNMLHIKG
jgi:cytochrome b6-f complex iron-sulfur subunit